MEDKIFQLYLPTLLLDLHICYHNLNFQYPFILFFKYFFFIASFYYFKDLVFSCLSWVINFVKIYFQTIHGTLSGSSKSLFLCFCFCLCLSCWKFSQLSGYHLLPIQIWEWGTKLLIQNCVCRPHIGWNSLLLRDFSLRHHFLGLCWFSNCLLYTEVRDWRQRQTTPDW